MISYFKMVKEFNEKYGHYTSDTPSVEVPVDVKLLKCMLVEEEIVELSVSLDMDDLIGIADGIADSIYVLCGMALAYGIPLDHVFEEVHRSNMTKSTEKDEFGKSLKGDYSPANIAQFLFKSVLGPIEEVEGY